MLKQALNYTPDTSLLFEKIAHEEWAIFLDSGKPHGEYGRFDIIVARPVATISIRHHRAYVFKDDATTSFVENNPFDLLQRIMQPYQFAAAEMIALQTTETGQSPITEIPFFGGAVGYVGYDIARYGHQLNDTAQDAADMPEMSIGIYDWAVVVDHREKTAWLVGYGLDERTEQAWESLHRLFNQPINPSLWANTPRKTPQQLFKVAKTVRTNMDADEYAGKFNQIKQYIVEGDCYQVNLAQRFTVEAEGSAWVAYKKLREISPAPFMAFMNLPHCQVLSGSPERFLQVVNQHVETRPIKGTRPRSANATEDAANANELKNSIKDQAENLMIVDLLRNDISKNCATGSVKANQLFNLQSFANVHHLVSTVTGTLAAGKTAIDLLAGCFPGGSITGAPKLRAMQIIEELEPHRRGLYCGAIGYIGFDGNMDTNIAIRTMVYANNEVSFYAGGGIVADSELDREYKETWDKAVSMLKLMQYFGANID